MYLLASSPELPHFWLDSFYNCHKWSLPWDGLFVLWILNLTDHLKVIEWRLSGTNATILHNFCVFLSQKYQRKRKFNGIGLYMNLTFDTSLTLHWICRFKFWIDTIDFHQAWGIIDYYVVRLWSNWNSPQTMTKYYFIKLAICLMTIWQEYSINSSPPGQNGRHFGDNIFRCIFMNEKFRIFIKISLKFVRRYPVHKNPALV